MSTARLSANASALAFASSARSYSSLSSRVARSTNTRTAFQNASLLASARTSTSTSNSTSHSLSFGVNTRLFTTAMTAAGKFAFSSTLLDRSRSETSPHSQPRCSTEAQSGHTKGIVPPSASRRDGSTAFRLIRQQPTVSHSASQPHMRSSARLLLCMRKGPPAGEGLTVQARPSSVPRAELYFCWLAQHSIWCLFRACCLARAGIAKKRDENKCFAVRPPLFCFDPGFVTKFS
ncbi:hypothetical protein PHSY_001879 [Pseudozyma hubeiensis SY62]|uniref:Uncharacterized protein n=1 Tax=Pseudozyma hubeiensis (strain SY62) TaxID=1305764 RepID=R9NZL4_PSEHS|nr:hypothetical protein PHSY_001879 [Pseudozyma hubeiensis SY62]GAC94308.1 hypothetical protein PHSY_001879 [Pseudozyma hubeiensis SY62]